MNNLSRWLCILAAAVLAVGLVGCGDGDDEADTNRGADTGTAADTADGGDVGRDADVAATTEPPCGVEPWDLGTLKVGQTGDDNLESWLIDERDPGCADAPASQGRLVRFEAATEAVLTLRAQAPGEVEPAMDVRTGGCDSDEVVACGIETRTRLIVEEDMTYHLWLTADSEESVTLQLGWEMRALKCRPSESPKCEGGAIEVCRNPDHTPTTHQCVEDTCGDAHSCSADTCEGAVELDTRNLPMTVPADQPAYHDVWSPEEISNCNLGGGPHVGVDAFFRLQNLSSGDELIFDARQSDSELAFYVIDGCSASECKAAGVYDDDGNNVATWTADTDGEAILVVDSLTEPNRQAFSFEVRRGP